MISDTLGKWLFIAPQGFNLAQVQLKNFLANQGHGTVLVFCDNREGDGTGPMDALPRLNVRPGIHVYNDLGAPDPFGINKLRVFDVYADNPDYSAMRKDQENKFALFGASTELKTDLFLLSWTCTPRAGSRLYNWELAQEPDIQLAEAINQITNPNTFGRRINVVHTDFFQYARATDVCLFLNQLVSIVDLSPPLALRAPETDSGSPRSLPHSIAQQESSQTLGSSLPRSTVFQQQPTAKPSSFLPRSTVFQQQPTAKPSSSLPRSTVFQQQLGSELSAFPLRSTIRSP